MSFRNFIDKLKRYFWFSAEELKAFVIVVLVGALIYSWNDWGIDRFDASVGIINFILAIILVTIAVFVHHAAQRVFALQLGFRAEQSLWWYGLIGGLLLAILTRGNLIFFAATSTMIHLLPIHRLGSFRYGPNLATLSKIVFMGPFANAALALLSKWLIFWGLVSPEAGHRFFLLNAMFALTSLLPIPPLDGSKIMYSSRIEYLVVFLCFAAFAVLGYVFRVYSATWAFVIGLGLSLLIMLIRKGD